MYGKTLQKIHQQENFLKRHLLLHTGNLLTLNAFWSTAKSAIPPQHYKEMPNVMKKTCQICNVVDTRPCLKLRGTTSIVNLGSFSCNSSNVVYLICNKCFNGEGNCIGETSTKFRI